MCVTVGVDVCLSAPPRPSPAAVCMNQYKLMCSEV